MMREDERWEILDSLAQGFDPSGSQQQQQQNPMVFSTAAAAASASALGIQ
jgi:hypothetical protein